MIRTKNPNELPFDSRLVKLGLTSEEEVEKYKKKLPDLSYDAVYSKIKQPGTTVKR